jgi:hemerythrin
MLSGISDRVAPSVLKRLMDYTRYHFAAEEAAMRETKYPEYARHKEEHEKLILQLVKACQAFQEGGGHLSTKLLGTMRQWLRTHILKADKAYSEHLTQALAGQNRSSSKAEISSMQT